MSNYMDAEWAPWAAGMRRIGTMIAMQPQMQANAQARQQQAGLMEARTATEGAQAEHYRAGTGKLNAETDSIVGERENLNQMAAAFGRLTEKVGAYQNAITAKTPPEQLAALKADVDKANAEAMAAGARAKNVKLGDMMNHFSQMPGMEAILQGGVAQNEGQMRMGSALMQGGKLPAAQAAGTTAQADAANQARGPKESTPEADSIQLRHLYAQLGKVEDALRANNSTEPGATVPRKKLRTEADAIRQQIAVIEGRGPRRLGDEANVAMANQVQDPDDSETGEDIPAEPAAVASVPTEAPVASAPSPKKKLTPEIAIQYLRKHGNRADAEKAAQADGYSW